MTPITRISRLRSCGVFRSFTWPPNLPEFKRYNLIYGWNGTGKTTLSRIFRNLGRREQPETGEVVLRTEDRNVTGEEFPQSNLQVRVFNRDFIEQSVFSVKSGEMPSIFVLGTESAEKQQEVERLKQQLVIAQSQFESAESNKNKASQNFDRFCIDRARVIKDTLRSSGQNSYNNYNKSDFRDEATKMLKSGDRATYRLTEADRGRLLSQHQATPKDKVTELAYAMPNLESVTDRVSELLQTTVVSAAIDTLKDDAELASWIRQGLALHQGRDIEKCQFCEQALPEHRLAALEGHFNDHYEQFIQRINQEIDTLKKMERRLKEFESALPNEEKLYDEYHAEFRVAKTQLTDVLQQLEEFLNAATQALEGKKSKVFESAKLDIETPPLKAEAAANLNSLIQKHNQASKELETRRKKARKRLADDMIAENLEEFVNLKEGTDTTKTTVETTKKEVEHLGAKVLRLEREITEHRRPAEELNEELRKYLGHDELRVEIKETGYTITRGRMPANSLSEGETTAIALLYFLKSLQGRDFTLENGVVVLDDPVSSLDANALFLASGLIRERTKDAGQLFVLTHNFSFFRQVRNWFRHVKGQNKSNKDKRPVRFFMLEPSSEDNVRSSTIRSLDPLLEKYESEYHYLFSQVYQASNSSESRSLGKNYILPNIARRMLETFLAFRFPHISSGNLREKLKKVQFDETKKLRIIRFLNTYSHSLAVGEPEHDLTALAEGSGVLNDLLEMIRSVDEAHHSAMVQLCKSEGELSAGGR